MSNIEEKVIKVSGEELKEILKFKPICNITLEYAADGLTFPTQDNSSHVRKLAARVFKNILFENNSGEINKNINYGNTAVNKSVALCSSYLTRISIFLMEKLGDGDLLMSYTVNKVTDDDSYIIAYTVKRAVV